ncbi:outer membrane beta-barrel protein [Helicobacter aurati]|uniref:Outer membrane beta-barrel protein n=1 Tax=Helicobacter aurati TaxID=137778 RepID=A0A3D8J3B6_9HELI|nr:outer membrane beta-barrel protein [Helicobacter aurati]RDU71969.1 outer membrane beta-barrel protein [Helicobacter aurati]
MKKVILSLLFYANITNGADSTNNHTINHKAHSQQHVSLAIQTKNISSKSAQKPLSNNKEQPTHSTKELQTYHEKLKYLQSLRYEVFNLREQIHAKGGTLESNLPYGNYLADNHSARKFNAIAQTYDDGLSKSGFFIGVGAGILDVFSGATINNNNTENVLVTRISPLVLSMRGGYQRFFNHYVGARIYGGIFLPATFFTPINEIDLKNAANYIINNTMQGFYTLGHLSVDVLFEVPLDSKFQHFIGGFTGINIGIMYYRTYDNKHHPVPYIWDYNLQVDYSFNIGVNLTFYSAHRIEMGLAVPFAYLTLPGFAQEANNARNPEFWRSAIFSVNYHLIF